LPIGAAFLPAPSPRAEPCPASPPAPPGLHSIMPVFFLRLPLDGRANHPAGGTPALCKASPAVLKIGNNYVRGPKKVAWPPPPRLRRSKAGRPKSLLFSETAPEAPDRPPSRFSIANPPPCPYLSAPSPALRNSRAQKKFLADPPSPKTWAGQIDPSCGQNAGPLESPP